MKKLSVGKKLVLGYGIMIGIILLSMLSALISIGVRSAALIQIEEMSQFQSIIRSGLQVYNEARVVAENAVLTKEASSFDKFEQLMGEAANSLAQAKGISAEMDAFMADQIVAFELASTQWASDVRLLYSSYNTGISSEEEYTQLAKTIRETGQRVYDQAVAISNGAEMEMQGFISSGLDQLHNSLMTRIGLTVAALLFGCIVARVTAHGIVVPLMRTSALIARVGESGDLSLSTEEEAYIHLDMQRGDEVGQTIRAFHHLLRHLEETNRCLMQVANRDLTGNITPLSPSDTMGNALETMSETLNKLLDRTHISSHQVATSSRQLAAGAESLAQNSAEQAAAVQQLNASISMIAAQSRQGVENSAVVIRRSQKIQNAAEEGKLKMEDMEQAIAEISGTAQSVQVIVKTINDIAFQTSILSLNAAIEAARAGADGRGFTEVARSVRELAALSENAVQEIELVLMGVVEKIENTVKYSQEASVSFERISEIVQRTVEDVGGMAEFVTDQSTMLEQIERSIEQIARSVSQNSQISEEVAAASEEMSAHAEQLNMMMSSFQLRKVEHSAEARLSDFAGFSMDKY